MFLGVLASVAGKSFLAVPLHILTGFSMFVAGLVFTYFIVHSTGSVKRAYKSILHIIIPILFISLLMGLAEVGGYFLLIVPGIVISLLLSQTYLVMISEHKRGYSALVWSWYYSRGRLISLIWRFIVLGFVILILTIPIILIIPGFSSEFFNSAEKVKSPSSLGAIANLIWNVMFISPFSILYSFALFKSIKETRLEELSDDEFKKIKKRVIIFQVIGVVGCIIALALVSFIAGIAFLKFLDLIKTEPIQGLLMGSFI